MCGIAGEIVAAGSGLRADAAAVVRVRDRMTHRGPDDAGLREAAADDGGGPVAVIGHRRLAVIDPGPAGHQPIATADGRYVLSYNGELYNDAELRRDLTAEGASFRTACDTETVLAALATWGAGALPRMRGMYGLALWDNHKRRLVLARDPLGIKPVHYAVVGAGGGQRLLFASEPAALFAHGAIEARPDLAALSAYLTTVRTTIGERTLFEGVRTLQPGEVLTVDASGDRLRVSSDRVGFRDERGERSGHLRELIESSIGLHLRSDVPMCSLLSGGIDSTIIAGAAIGRAGALTTYCSGARVEGEHDDDFAHARRAAAAIGSRHIEVPVDQGTFGERWRGMIAETGVPLSTPNEVAINAVARRLRADGHVVALSGEGADELLGGYELPMASSSTHVLSTPDDADDGGAGGAYQVWSNAWMSAELKAMALTPEAARSIEGDAVLLDRAGRVFEALAAEVERDFPEAEIRERRLQTHLRYQRAVNLEGLLRRLDSATMLASVEGRTPFADRVVAGACERLAMAEKFQPGVNGEPAQTKISLRRALAGTVPDAIVSRKKASFPLPFEAWVGEAAAVLESSAFAAEVFSPAARLHVMQRPGELWNLAWPMINVALWGERWWG